MRLIQEQLTTVDHQAVNYHPLNNLRKICSTKYRKTRPTLLGSSMQHGRIGPPQISLKKYIKMFCQNC